MLVPRLQAGIIPTCTSVLSVSMAIHIKLWKELEKMKKQKRILSTGSVSSYTKQFRTCIVLYQLRGDTGPIQGVLDARGLVLDDTDLLSDIGFHVPSLHNRKLPLLPYCTKQYCKPWLIHYNSSRFLTRYWHIFLFVSFIVYLKF